MSGYPFYDPMTNPPDWLSEIPCENTASPDPKPEPRRGNKPRRLFDPEAVKLGALAEPECAACGAPATNGDHVLPKDRGGDDVGANVIGLCGTGTSRCHGAKHGNPYTDEETGERRDQEWVMTAIGRTLKTRRRDCLLYLTMKLGYNRASDYLKRTYHLDFDDDGPDNFPAAA